MRMAAPLPVSSVYPQALIAANGKAATVTIAILRRSRSSRKAKTRVALVMIALSAMIGTTAGAPTIGTSTSGISNPVP